jgi:hypothetical protein
MPDRSEPKKRLGRWTRGSGGGRADLSREALEREAAAEMGLIQRREPDERDDPPAPAERSSAAAPPAPRARRQWSRLRDALATESDAARRERLEREAADELRFDGRRADGDEE